jgi:hypothetical protein
VKGVEEMSELTRLESKLGEVTGLAMAAQAATQKVIKLAREEGENELVSKLEQMQGEAAETERKCTDLASSFDGKKTAILSEARETKAKASAMMKTYLDPDANTLDGFEFLTMAEAGEVGHWSVLKQLSHTANDRKLKALVDWALPLQTRHLADVFEGSRQLATSEDPGDPA